jgi:hypothetical protein
MLKVGQTQCLLQSGKGVHGFQMRIVELRVMKFLSRLMLLRASMMIDREKYSAGCLDT